MKKLSVVCVSFLLLFLNSNRLYAQDLKNIKPSIYSNNIKSNLYNIKTTKDKNNIKSNNQLIVTPHANYYDIDENGNFIIFPTLDDYILYDSINNSKISFRYSPGYSNRYGYEWKIINQSEKELYFHFIQYHPGTKAWAKANEYTILSGETFKVSTTYTWSKFTFDLGFSYSYSVNTSIPADPSRYSRLGIYADYTLKQYELKQYQYGQPTGETRTLSYATKNNSYIEPKYK